MLNITYARIKLILFFAFFSLPIILSYWKFYYWQPYHKTSTINYGKLLPLTSLISFPLWTLENLPFTLGSLQGKWILLQVDSGNCDENCLKKLYFMRQLRLMQGKDMQRIERVWIIDDHLFPTHELRHAYLDTYFLRSKMSLPTSLGAVHEHLYLIDPLGNVMLQYPENPEPKKVMKDLHRLLQVSQIG